MELLKRLNESFSVCGYEDEIREVVVAYLSSDYAVYVDALGNVIAEKHGNGKCLSFAAPMDVGGVFLNCEKTVGCYHYVNLCTFYKTTTEKVNGRTFDGCAGTFQFDSEDAEKSYFETGGEKVSLPNVAMLEVPFSVNEDHVTSRHAALFALLKLAKSLTNTSCSVKIVALAQTSTRHRGAYGNLPRESDFYTLIEPWEEERFKVGNGPVLCLKDGSYLMPVSLRPQFDVFTNRLIWEEKTSLAASMSRQQDGRMIASVKIPVRGIGTNAETFSLYDIEKLCDKLMTLA